MITDKCYVCGKRLRDPNVRSELFLEDDGHPGVTAGPDCVRKALKAGAAGIATRSGPRVFYEIADAKRFRAAAVSA